ncbi:MAG: glycosyl hydrolase-related protein [Actinomycetes bacterium]
MTTPAYLVSHTHWDREWYRTFQAFRARLVDAVDRVLDLVAADPGYVFVLDGQAVVLEDYVAVRPSRRAEIEAGCATGRLGIGPWYVQPDMLLPSGEAHVRNLLEGRRVAAVFGPVSKVGYAPDSFGHPAQLPQILAGFGLDTFVYWRGNGSEIDHLPPRYGWVAPDGTQVVAHHLRGSYSGAGSLPADLDAATTRLVQLGEKQLADGADRVLLMNGNDHTLPDARTAALAEGLSSRTGWSVRRVLLDEAVAGGEDVLATYAGDLLGGRVANLLPGVWSTRTYLKLRNRYCESRLEGWAEPWAAFGSALRLPDEQPALRIAWRALLANQAHDSICGCSIDAVHEQMQARYDEAGELAHETTTRVLERIAGLGTERLSPWTDTVDVAVFNASPFPMTDVVRLPLDGFPPIVGNAAGFSVPPLLALSLQGDVGLTIDGAPARVVADHTARFGLLPEHQLLATEFVVEDVPAFGWKRVALAPGPRTDDTVDNGREIEVDDTAVVVADDGTLHVRIGDREWSGLFAVEDVTDKGDTYDFDPDPHGETGVVALREVRRERHLGGIERLLVALEVTRGDVSSALSLRVRLATGVPRVDVEVQLDNNSPDHRLRLLFPTGAPQGSCRAATTFGVSERVSGHVADAGWMHIAPVTWPHQGWLAAGGLVVAAPGLPEGEVLADGTLAVTLLRSTGWLSAHGLSTRPEPAGPGIATPGAQCLGSFTAHIALFADSPQTPARARAAELGLRAVLSDANPLVADGHSLLALEPSWLVLSAFKPAEDADGAIVRVLNPSDDPAQAELRVGVAFSDVSAVRLDETPTPHPVARADDTVRFDVPPHALRSIRVRWS